FPLQPFYNVARAWRGCTTFHFHFSSFPIAPFHVLRPAPYFRYLSLLPLLRFLVTRHSPPLCRTLDSSNSRKDSSVANPAHFVSQIRRRRSHPPPRQILLRGATSQDAMNSSFIGWLFFVVIIVGPPATLFWAVHRWWRTSPRIGLLAWRS